MPGVVVKMPSTDEGAFAYLDSVCYTQDALMPVPMSKRGGL